jgi:hypothetical protein
LDVTGTSGGLPILGRSAALRMEAPKEGVVSRAWITADEGKPVKRVPPGTRRLVAHFVYAAKPFIGSKVTVTWYIGGQKIGTVRAIRWKPIVHTDITSPAGLPNGTYVCELRARNLIVYRVSARVG